MEKEVESSHVLSHEMMDAEEKEGIGPMSIMLPYVDRVKDVDAYFVKGPFDPVSDGFDYANDFVSRLIPRHSIRPVSIDTVMFVMPKDTNLGLPELTRNKGALPNYRSRALAARVVDDFYAAVIGWRGQQSGTPIPKQRVIWMMDHAETILALMFMHALLGVLRKLPGFAAWSTPDVVDVAMTRIINKAKQKGLNIYSFDYSRFDTSISVSFIKLIWDYFINWFTPNHSDRLSLMREVFSTIPLVVPWEVRRGRSGTVPSGSGWTNLFDSLANCWAGYYAAGRLGIDVLDYEVMGDDGVFLFSDNPEANDLSGAMAEIGLTMSEEKQHISPTTIHYLQRMHDDAYRNDGVCVGVRSIYRFLSGASSFERFRRNWNKYMTSMRLVMQANNCMWYPNFSDFVRFVVNGDDLLRSGMDVAEIAQRAGGADVIRSTLGLASFPFSVSDPSGVENFAFTRVARDLR
jgi:hypothetical protein